MCALFLSITVSLAVTVLHDQAQGHPCKETHSKSPNGTKVNCRDLHLDHIPCDLPRDTVWLDFTNNNLYTLTDYMFQDLHFLQHLDLTTCQISKLEEKAFWGAESLDVLILANNHLTLDKETYPPDIFLPLISLTYLDIGGNDGNDVGTVPDNVFINLPNLQTLYTDTFARQIFRSGFAVMSQLKSLVLSDFRWQNNNYCAILFLYNDTFLVFENSSVEILDMGNCVLHGIEAEVYLPLKYLSEIVLKDVDNLLVKTAITSLAGLNNRNITRLNFHRMYSKSPANGIDEQVIKADTLAGLTNICVEYIDLSQNWILFIHNDFVTVFGECIKYIDLSRNSLFGDLRTLFTLSTCPHLEYFDVSHQNRFGRGTGLPFSSHTKQPDNFTVYLPPKLRVFNVSSMSSNMGELGRVQIYQGSSLRTFNLSYNGIKHMVFRMNGIEYVEELDMSGNYGGDITGEFMQTFPNVKWLSANRIGPDQLSLIAGSSFYRGIKNLLHVEIISLESNNIQFMGRDIFNGMSNLTSISLADNNFDVFPFDIRKVSRLSHLDLSSNSITYLSTETTEYLDELEQQYGFVLNLRKNPLSCSCQTLEFIQWLFTTRVVLDDEGDYNCVTDDGRFTTTKEVYQHWNYHWTGCQGRVWLPIAIIFMFFVTVILLASILLLRNWTRVQRHIMIILGRGVQRVTRKDFKNDAYIAHSEEDGRLVMGNVRAGLEHFRLRLILPDRDFLPGQYVADNVVESVNNSWKTVLIVTDSFLDDPWSYFIMRTVSYSVSYPNSNRVILLMKGDVNRGRLPESLLNVTEEEDILETDEFPGPDSDIWTEIRDRVLSEAI